MITCEKKLAQHNHENLTQNISLSICKLHTIVNILKKLRKPKILGTQQWWSQKLLRVRVIIVQNIYLKVIMFFFNTKNFLKKNFTEEPGRRSGAEVAEQWLRH